MTFAASLDRSGRLRLFFGLPLPIEPARTLATWAGGVFAERDGVRPVPSAQLHVTLAFLGARPAEELDILRGALRDAAVGLAPPVLTPVRYRETERVGMLVFEDEGGGAGMLQARLSERLVALGIYRPERRPWLPHATVARHRTRPRLRPALPELGQVSPSEAALYHSSLRPRGAQYDILDAVVLGGI